MVSGIQIVKKIGKGHAKIVETDDVSTLKIDDEFSFLRYIAEQLQANKIKQIQTSLGNCMTVEEFQKLECDKLYETLNHIALQQGKSAEALDAEFHPKNKEDASDLSFEILKDGKCFGGIFGIIENQVLYVEILWVHEELRGKSLGRKLLDLLEQCAQKDFSCLESRVTSTTYEATWLYESEKSKYDKKFEVAIPYKHVDVKLDVALNGNVLLDLLPNIKTHYARWYSKKLA